MQYLVCTIIVVVRMELSVANYRHIGAGSKETEPGGAVFIKNE